MNSDDHKLYEKIKSVLMTKIKEGKNIFTGWFFGHDAANVQLTCSDYSDGQVVVMYCYYGQMWNFQYTKQELGL